MCEIIVFYTLRPQYFKSAWMTFKFGYMVTIDRIADISTFGDLHTQYEQVVGGGRPLF